jgi:hypothetical protein
MAALSSFAQNKLLLKTQEAAQMRNTSDVMKKIAADSDSKSLSHKQGIIANQMKVADEGSRAIAF